MARTRTTPQSLTFGQALTPTFLSVDIAGHVVAQARNDVMVMVQNSSGGPITVTVPAIATTRPADDIFPRQDPPDIVLTIPDGKIGIVTSVPDSHLENGDFYLDFSDDSGVTMAVVKFPQ